MTTGMISHAAVHRAGRFVRFRFLRRRLSLAPAFLALALGACGGKTGEAGDGEKQGGESERTGADSVVVLDTAALALAGIETATAAVQNGSTLTANGTITYDANHVSVVAPRAEGRVAGVRADLGQRVAAGAVLAVVESGDVGQTRGELDRSRANVELARQNFEREQRLYAQSISSQKEMIEAEAAYRTAQADYASAASKLRSLGAGRGQGGTYALTSPIAGTVVERNATPGQIAGPETPLFTVADLRRVWITVDVYEADAERVGQGMPAMVTTRAMPGISFTGRVTYAGGVVDTASRTVKMRVEVDNPGLRLRPGMYAQVLLQGPGGAAATGPLVVPELAVQDVNGRTVVFVPGATPGRFVVRPVTVGERMGSGLLAITAGLAPGERYVVKGAFQLRSEMLKASFGGDED